MTHYKVVSNEGGTLYSCWTPGTFRELYVPNVARTPFIGKAFLFGDLDAAQRFVGASPGTLEIWECEAVGIEIPQSVLPQKTVVDDAKVSQETVHAFWRDDLWNAGDPSIRRCTFASFHANGPITVPLIRPPEGTLLADTVTLLRKIQ